MNEPVLKEKPARILVVDDDLGVRNLIQTLLTKAGFRAEVAAEALIAQQLLADHEYDVVISDIMMPGISGIELLKLIHQDTPDLPVILITGNPDLKTASEAIRTASAVDYLCKPFSVDQILQTVKRAVGIKRIRDENRRLTAENNQYQLHLEEMVKEKSAELATAYDELSSSYDFTLEALVAMLDARENATGQHSIRVRNLSLILGREMRLSFVEMENIARGTLLHDIGKIAIPDTILLKPSQLTKDEWVIMKSHVQIGYDIVKSSERLSAAAEIILSHHEKYDGSGYPRGLKGDAICLGGRIFSIIDAYDAMRSVRIYKKAFSAELAVEEVIRCSGAHFDPAVVAVFLTCQSELEQTAQWDRINK